MCSKPRCVRTGAVALAYDYSNQRAVLHDPPHGELSPHLYALCLVCAEKLQPPRGWTLEDERTEPPLFAPAPAVVGAAIAGPEASAAEEEPVRQQLFFGSSN